jgi:hypothetical protein
MDIGFEIIIPVESSISQIQFAPPTYLWDGKLYAQGPPEATFDYFKLLMSDVPEHILSLLPHNFRERKWQCVAVVNGVQELVQELTIQSETEFRKNSVLSRLIRSLLANQPNWIVVFEPGYDRIDEVVKGDPELVVSKIFNSLSIEKKGFIVWHESHE